MAVAVTVTVTKEADTSTPRTWRSVVVLVAWLVACVAPFVVGLVIPYYVNGLDALPLAELTSGAHDPKDLWPQGSGRGWVDLAAGLSLSLAPLGVMAVGGLSALAVVQEFGTFPQSRRAARPVAVALLLVALTVAALLIWSATPMASALVSWRLD
ncbi:hypothetical protein E4P39_02670 [Blastococcus sp. CT_GayMR19]|uniref:hypothetical protein n=1 Tax=Blastococcus sp. CT_GayMR19 TaxID=2559608 RepID=UPI0010737950|nr:hypothetical protein [Blastococcus sp. CT_GayMR19]TFV78164.1 hypothetical protein E4P39_02670 [Blastococcus sp. CT_GayMR19]